MDLAREALTSLSRSHPSPELAHLSSDLTSIAKRTEAVAQRCTKTKGSLQEGLQLHFKGRKWDWSSYIFKSLELQLCLYVGSNYNIPFNGAILTLNKAENYPPSKQGRVAPNNNTVHVDDATDYPTLFPMRTLNPPTTTHTASTQTARYTDALSLL